MPRYTITLLIAILLTASSLPGHTQTAAPTLTHKALQNKNFQHRADSALSRMTLKEKVGQLFIYTIAPLQTKENLAQLHRVVETYKVGGLLFSSGKLTNQIQLTNRAQAEAKTPLMITFDGEWGLSMRLSGTPVFPRNATLGKIKDNRLLYEYGQEVARQCREIGVHVNFAPVADINLNPNNKAIGTRSFGNNPAQVAEKVTAYASGLESGKVLSVSKHFPGHGDTDVDSHKALPILPFTRQRLDTVELVPFKQIIAAGMGGIMVGHLHVTALEGTDKKTPASLSPNAVQGLLKNELGFQGLVFTDALTMKGTGTGAGICLRALKAGNDIVLAPPTIKEEINEVLRGIERGEISEQEIDRKCRKVLLYKYALGLTHRPTAIKPTGLESRLNTPNTRNLILRLNQAAANPDKTPGTATTPPTTAPTTATPTILQPEKLKAIDNIALEGIQKKAYPGCQIVILKDGQPIYDKCFGTHTGTAAGKKVQPTDLYDVASLTKTTATLPAVMKLYDKGLFKLDDKLADYLPMLKETDKKDITIREVLFHQAGLPAGLSCYKQILDETSIKGPLYSRKRTRIHTIRTAPGRYANSQIRYKQELISGQPDTLHTIQVADHLWLNPSFKELAMSEILNTPLKRKTYRYSCVGFILLQQLAEKLSGMPLDKYLAQEFYQPMGLTRTAYQPLRYFPKEAIVPSTDDQFLRKTVLRGFVHDESAAMLGGISGNAGLFSSAEDIARVHQMLLNGGTFNGHRYLSEETCRLFTTTTSPVSHRGLGFNKPNTQKPNLSPCSSHTPPSVYGHTGFTGSCAWVDPDNKLIYVFLCNRLYPNAWANQLNQLNIRERIQDAMYEALVKL